MESRSIDSLPHGYRLQGEKNEYIIDHVLGQGAFGITYLARYKASIQGSMGAGSVWAQVAVKEFFMRDMNVREGETGYLNEVSQDSLIGRYRRAFMREARNLASLQHPNIVNVFEVIEANNTVYIVMEYINGGSLDEHIQSKGSLPEEESINSILKVCSAVDLMHSKKILHLDIKPKNIMLDEEGSLYLIDFGLSKQFTPDGEPESSTSIGLGTPGYAPVEQAEHQDGDKQFRATLDIYALGATLFKMLTGNTPPKASQVSDSVIDGNNIISEQLKKAGVSEELDAVVAKAMWPSSRGRYQSVKELVQAFNDLNKPVQSKQAVAEDDSTQILADTVKLASTPKVEDDVTVFDSIDKKSITNNTQSQPAQENYVKESIPTSSKPSFEKKDEEKSKTKVPIIIAIVCAIIFIIFVISKCGSGNTNFQSSTDNGDSKSISLQQQSTDLHESIIESISLNNKILGLYEGDSYTLKVTITPSSAANKKITWSSSDNQIIIVDQSGTIRAVKRGQATITAKCDGMAASCTVYVNSNQPQITENEVIEPSNTEETEPSNISVSSIRINISSITLVVGSTSMLTVEISPSNATNKTVKWSSSDTQVATVDRNGKVTALKPGLTGIWASCDDKEAYCTVTVINKTRSYSGWGHEYVDLGLSVFWATYNVGSTSLTGSGDYYAWGEINTKETFSWINYRFRIGGDNFNDVQLSKYNYSNSYGKVDNKMVLDSDDDVARSKWRSNWRIPTDAEFKELIDNCTWKFINLNGKNGYLVTSKIQGYTDSYIFLPAAGYKSGSNTYGGGSLVNYWTSNLSSHPSSSWHLYGDPSSVSLERSTDRSNGRSVRPVFK